MDDRPIHNPPRTGAVGMALFLASLGVLFLAAMVAYAIIRTQGRLSPPPGTIELPTALWVSTAAILLSGVTLQHALNCVRRERQRRLRLAMGATLGLTVLFITVQTPAMTDLLRTHEKLMEQQLHLYGMLFVLVLLHALHVIGGLIPMVVIGVKAWRCRYDHEHHAPVRYLAAYWHFLAIVWCVMLALFLVLA
jgi:cytochrome c oxidase subunit III